MKLCSLLLLLIMVALPAIAVEPIPRTYGLDGWGEQTMVVGNYGLVDTSYGLTVQDRIPHGVQPGRVVAQTIERTRWVPTTEQREVTVMKPVVETREVTVMKPETELVQVPVSSPPLQPYIVNPPIRYPRITVSNNVCQICGRVKTRAPVYSVAPVSYASVVSFDDCGPVSSPVMTVGQPELVSTRRVEGGWWPGRYLGREQPVRYRTRAVRQPRRVDCSSGQCIIVE